MFEIQMTNGQDCSYDQKDGLMSFYSLFDQTPDDQLASKNSYLIGHKAKPTAFLIGISDS